MEVNQDTIKQMQGSKLFDGLTTEELTELNKIAEVQLHPAGKTIILEDEQGNSFYWVRSGRLEVQIQGIKPERPQPLVLNTIRAGEIFGEMILLGKNRRTASIVVKNEAALLSWKHHDVLKLFSGNAAVGYKVMSNLAKMLSERLLDMNFQLRNHTELLGSNLSKYF